MCTHPHSYTSIRSPSITPSSSSSDTLVTSSCASFSMENVIRKLQKIWAGGFSRRRQHSEGGYTKLRSHDKTLVPEKQLKMKKKSRVAPRGCFSVCVGPEKQKFAIKIEHANHPRFLALLEKAENEYGNSIHHEGLIYLPCHVDVFHEALAEILIPNFD